MLEGLSSVHDEDIASGKRLLLKYFKKKPGSSRTCLELCAGIGRVTKEVLSEFFDEIDIVDFKKSYVDMAKEKVKKIRNGYVLSMKDYNPTELYYGIWCQWSLMYLTDDDLIVMLKKLSAHLEEDGFIVVRENTFTRHAEVNTVRGSINRSKDYLEYIFREVGLTVVEFIPSNDD